MPAQTQARSIDTVVVGGGQAGLAVAYHLRRLRREHVVLEAEKRIGDSWRRRWDSLRLFSPARYDALPGRRFPAPSGAFPTKDQVAEYLESYREHFELPVETGTRVTRLSKVEGRFLVEADAKSWVCRNVVVATSSFRTPHVPAFASRLDPGINQLTPKEYRNPGQLLDGTVLVVGASDTGVELALEAAASHPTVLAGKHPGHIPFRIEGVFGRAFGVPVVIGILFHYVLSVDTPIGRKVRPKMLGHAGPNVRFKPRDVAAAGVRRVGRVADARDADR